jgi:signal transduction histidine kinase
MTTTAEASADRWNEQIERFLPLGMLAIGTAVAMVTGPSLGALSPWPRLAAQLGIVALTAGWLILRVGRPMTAAAYVLRTAAAFVLTALNPLFCIFAWVGYIDADEVFRGRRMWAGIGVTAVIMAIGQSGGLPFTSLGQTALVLVLLLVNFGIAFAVGRVVLHQNEVSAERKVAITELEKVNASLQQALAENAQLHERVVEQARAAGVQEERQRLAGELHDTIAQSLAGILAQLQAASDDADPAQARRRMDRAVDLARDALVEARRSMMDLVPAPLEDQMLADAMATLVKGWAAHQSIRAELVVTGLVRQLHPEVEATLVRIAQEALSNVAKHARARRVGVTLSYIDDEIVLDVRDDGAGFDSGTPPRSTSFGLRGMRQRAERLAGLLTIETEQGAGTAVSVRLPAVERGAA